MQSCDLVTSYGVGIGTNEEAVALLVPQELLEDYSRESAIERKQGRGSTMLVQGREESADRGSRAGLALARKQTSKTKVS